MKTLICAVGALALAVLPASASTTYDFGTIGGNNAGNGISLGNENYTAGTWHEYNVDGVTTTANNSQTNENIDCIVSLTNTTHICGNSGPNGAANIPIPSAPAGSSAFSGSVSNYFITDSDPNWGAPIATDLTGLTVGGSYTVSFYQATSEEVGASPPTSYTDNWQAYLLPGVSSGVYMCPFSYCSTVVNPDAGDLAFSSAGMLNTPNPGPPVTPVSTAWGLQSFTFTATSSSEVLEFVAHAVGNTPFVPPLVALADVTLTQNSATPEPGTWQLMILGAGVIFIATRIRRRVAAKA